MSECAKILAAIEVGDHPASDSLLPLVFDNFRTAAREHLAPEQPGQAFQATALAHEAQVRLLGEANPEQRSGRGHFFAMATAAIRQILIETTRQKWRVKRVGDRRHDQWNPNAAGVSEPREALLSLDATLEKLAVCHPQAAELVQLLYFAGLKLAEAAFFSHHDLSVEISQGLAAVRGRGRSSQRRKSQINSSCWPRWIMEVH